MRIGLAYFALLALVDVLAYSGRLPSHLVAFPGYDVIGHFFLIGLAGYLLHRALARRVLWALPVGFVIVAVAAGIEEGLQAFSPARTASVGDLAADLGGLALFALLDLAGRSTQVA